MSSKGFKSALPRPSAREALSAAQAVAEEAGLPPATLPPTRNSALSPLTQADENLVQLNVRVRRTLGDQLADRARAEGITQKVLVCRALAAAGFDVHPEDLKPTLAPRRRGAEESY